MSHVRWRSPEFIYRRRLKMRMRQNLSVWVVIAAVGVLLFTILQLWFATSGH